jgi:hypothetical protein
VKTPHPPFLYHDVSQFDIGARNQLLSYGVKKRKEKVPVDCSSVAKVRRKYLGRKKKLKSRNTLVLLLRFGVNISDAQKKAASDFRSVAKI